MNTFALSDLLERARRPIAVEPEEEFIQIGVRSFGRGVFVKEPVTGKELGNKKVFRVEQDDLVLNIVFAWEGAVALVGEAEHGLCGSHRFPTYRATDLADVRFLRLLLLSGMGLRLLQDCSPGSAGRNRTLNQTALLEARVAVPSLHEQQRLSDAADAISDAQRQTEHVRVTALALRAAVLEEHVAQSRAPLRPLGELAQVVKAKVQPSSAGSLPYVGLEHLSAARSVVSAHGEASSVTSTKTLFEEGDVLFGKLRPYLRKSAAARWAGICSTDILALRAVSGVLPEYLALLLGSRLVIERAVMTAAGTRMPRTNWSALAELEVPVPSIAVQEHVAAALLSIEETVVERERRIQVLARLQQNAVEAALLAPVS